MAKRAVIDTGDTMVAIIMDVLEHVEPTNSNAIEVGDRIRILSGLYSGVIGDVRLIISGDDQLMRGKAGKPPKRRIS